jgi:hypothetical protein
MGPLSTGEVFIAGAIILIENTNKAKPSVWKRLFNIK